MKSIFVTLSAVATAAFIEAGNLLSSQQYWQAVLVGAFGLVCFAAYEMIPDKKNPPTE